MRYSLFTTSVISSYHTIECKVDYICNYEQKAMWFCKTHGVRKTCEGTWSTTLQNVRGDVRGHGHCIELTVVEGVHVQWVFLSVARKIWDTQLQVQNGVWWWCRALQSENGDLIQNKVHPQESCGMHAVSAVNGSPCKYENFVLASIRNKHLNTHSSLW